MTIHAINSFQTAGLSGANGYLASLFGAGSGRGLASLASLSGQGFSGVGRAAPSIGPTSGISPAFTGRRSESPGAFISAAFQRSQDGDVAFFGSRAGELSAEDREAIRELSARDQEVRTHELAHLAAAGSLAKGGATYDFTTGPDGKRYAVGGSVQIDTSPGSTPQETLVKAQQIRSAALAPSEPSGADREVAAQAAQLEIQAQQDLASSETVATDSVLSDGEGNTYKTGGGITEPIATPSDSGDTDDSVDEGDVTDEAGVTFARGSANSAFNRAEFPGRGHAHGHFKGDKNANAVENSAHGFSRFGTDPSATIEPVDEPIVDPVDDTGDAGAVPIDNTGSDPIVPDSSTGGSGSGELKDTVDSNDPFGVLTGGELDLIG